MTKTKPTTNKPIPAFILTRYQVRFVGSTNPIESFRSGKEASEYADNFATNVSNEAVEVFDKSQKKVIHTTSGVIQTKLDEPTRQAVPSTPKTSKEPKNTDKVVDGKISFTLIGDVCGYISDQVELNIVQSDITEPSLVEVGQVWGQAETKEIGIFKGKSRRVTATMNEMQLTVFLGFLQKFPKNERKNVDFSSNPDRNIYWGLKRAVDKVQNLIKTAF